MVLVDGQGLPLAVRLESASPSEVTPAEATLAQVRVPRPQGRPRQKPELVITDMPGSDNFVVCWFAMNIYSAVIDSVGGRPLIMEY